jgi:CHAD domain-containing protein
LEIEAKFSIPDEKVFERLLETTNLAGFQLGEASIADLHDRYLDTANGAVRAGGYACRLRWTGHHYRASLKGLGGASGAIHRRMEYEVALTESLPPHSWPASSARDLAVRLCGAEPVDTLFEIAQERHARPLMDGDRSVAEFALDRVQVCAEGLSEETVGYLEVEAELKPDGSEADLEKLVAELQNVWGLAPESRSKFERALALVAEGPANEANSATRPVENELSASGHLDLLDRPGVGPDDPMSEAGRKTLRFHYRRMLYNEPGTRQGADIEALHDMRVATRRLRAAFRVFGSYYARKDVAPYLKGLRRTGRALGAVRDLDVFRAKIQAYLETLPASERASLDDLLATLEERREAARRRMIAYLDGEKYGRLVERFGRFVETEGMGSLPVAPNGGRPRPYRVRHVAPAAIYDRLSAVRAYNEWVTVPDPPLARLHSLRIACKRLRYTLEFFGEVLGPDTQTLVQKIVAMQDHLGDLQDAVVASGILRDYLALGSWGRDVWGRAPREREESHISPGVAAYLAATQSDLRRLVEAFPEVWARLNATDFSRMVAETVSVL